MGLDLDSDTADVDVEVDVERIWIDGYNVAVVLERVGVLGAARGRLEGIISVGDGRDVWNAILYIRKCDTSGYMLLYKWFFSPGDNQGISKKT